MLANAFAAASWALESIDSLSSRSISGSFSLLASTSSFFGKITQLSFTGLLTFALKYLDRINTSANYIFLNFINKYLNIKKT